jgi:hypothetical protein
MSHLNLIDAEPTNRKRRGVQGKCATCGSPIPAAKRLCPDCRQQEQEVKQGIHTWKSPSGEAVKRQVASVHVSAKVVFDISAKQFPIDSPSGPFLETLIGICYQQPSYIRADDVPRYAALLDALMRFQFQREPWEKDSPMVAVQDTPLKRLGLAVREWIMSFFAERHHPVMPTYALDAACFVAAHGEGTCLSSDRSPPAVLPQMVDGDFSINCIGDRGFKNDFTQRLFSHRITLAEVPEGGTIVGPDRERFGPGAKFLFRITRCFLSESRNEYVDLEAREENPPDYDISTALLPGQLWVDASELPVVSSAHARTGRERRLYVPLRWITHAVRESEDGTILLPVPQWE